MVKDKDIKQFFQQHKPDVKNNGPFLKEVVRLAELYLVLNGDAPFYILDEPFTQVDPVNIEDVKSMIRERANDHGVIITDHNYDAISSVADNLFVIADGYTNQVRSREDLVRHDYLRVEG